MSQDKPKELTKRELDFASPISGEVRISLSSYHELVSNSAKATDMADRYEMGIQAVQQYLTFLRRKKDIDFGELMEEFNEKNDNLMMYVDESGSVRFTMK